MHHAILVCGLLTLPFSLQILGAERTVDTKPAIDQQRRDLAIRQLTCDEYFIRLRAIDELADIAGKDSRARDALIEHLFAVPAHFMTDPLGVRRIAWGLASTDDGSLERILQEYRNRNRKAKDSMLDLLIVLGYRGSKAAKAVPFLLERSQESGTPETVRCAVQALLANLGHEPDRIRGTIVSSIRDRTECGEGAIEAMVFTGAGLWADDEMIAELITCLDGTADQPAHAVLVLGRLGPKAAAAAEPLRMLAEKERKDGSFVGILCELALAEIDHPQRGKWLRTALGHIGPRPPGRELSWLPASLSVELLKDIEQFVEDKDPMVASGAIAVLGFVGLPANKTAPALFRILEKHEQEQLRRIAAWALVRR